MKFFLVFLTVVITFGAGSQPPQYRFTDSDRLVKINAMLPVVDKIFSDYALQNKIPGMAYGIMVDGQLITGRGIGFTDLKEKIPASERSMFRIASMTKSVTAMAILILRKQGKLRLDDPAELYIPEMKQITPLTTDAPKITIRHLLTHAEGLPEDNPWGDRQLDTRDEQLLDLLKKGVSFSNVPGVAYEYSNLGFALLGKIIGNVSGKSYQQFINEELFKPLGMMHTVWEYTEVPKALLAHGYRYEDEQWKEEELLHDGTYGAMGGLITSIADFAKYVAFHQAAWPASDLADDGIISRADVREMHQPWNFNNLNLTHKYPGGRTCALLSSYGYGLRHSRDCEGRISIGHTGGLPGFGSNWQILTDFGIGIISHANKTYSNMSMINTIALDTLVRAAGLKPRELVPSKILVERQMQLMKLLPGWTDAEKSGIFAVNFFPDHSVRHRKARWDELYTKIGVIKRVGEIVPENHLRGKFVIEGTKGAIQVFFTLSPESPALIQQLDFK